MKLQQTAISAHCPTLTDRLAFHSQGQTILVTFVTKKWPVACITILGLKLGTGVGSVGGVVVKSEKALSD